MIRAEFALLQPRRHGLRAILLGILTLLSALTEGLGLTLLVPMLAALGANGGSGRNGAMALTERLGIPLQLEPLLAMFVALVVLRGLIGQARSMAAQRFEAALVDDLRLRAWRALIQSEWRTLSSLRRSDSTSLLLGEIDRIGDGVNQALAALSHLGALLAVGLAALVIAPLQFALALPALLAALLAHRLLRRHAGRLGDRLNLAWRMLHAQVLEGLAALRSIKVMGREAQVETEFAEAMARLRRAQADYIVSQGWARVALHCAAAVGMAAVVWLSVRHWHLGAAQALPIVALCARAIPAFGALTEAWQNWAHAQPALTSAQALIAHAEAAREAMPSPAAPGFAHSLELDQVTVHFAGETAPALDAISLSLSPRGLVVIQGQSGAGKSTLADLVCGLLSPDSGTVRIDGLVLEGAVRQAWRRRVAYVQQDPVLLAGTIRENLLWSAPQASEPQLEAALRDAAADYVLALPEGLDTRVGDGGRVLSGGERQRLMLARALLRNPALLVLDEATSALDAANEAAVAQAIMALKPRMAILVIAHRGALTALADQVVTLEAGRIVAISGMNERT